VTSILVRHAWAGHWGDWGDDDRLRPLDSRGRRQAEELVELFSRFEVRRIVSSPYLRCVATVEPLAAALGLTVEHDDRLGEGAGGRGAAELLREEGLVACTHGDVAEEVLGHGLKKGAAVVLDDGAVVGRIKAP